MNQSEWLRCEDSWPMLCFLEITNPSERKIHLFVCACCRHCHWDSLLSLGLEGVIAISERFADGLTSRNDLRAAHELCAERANQLWGQQEQPPEKVILANWAAKVATGVSQVRWGQSLPPSQILWAAKYMRGPRLWKQLTSLKAGQVRVQCDLLRDMFVPFSKVAILPSWLTWKDSVIPRAAQSIYDTHKFENMPILADALEEAGCSETFILEHCRNGLRHTRGCWLLDVLLGRA